MGFWPFSMGFGPLDLVHGFFGLCHTSGFGLGSSFGFSFWSFGLRSYLYIGGFGLWLLVFKLQVRILKFGL